MLRRVGDLTAAEVAERVFDGIDAARLLRELERERRAIRLRVGGEERYVAADEAGLYRDALGAVPPGGLPEAFLEDVPDALRVLVARFARTHGPFTTGELHARYGVDASAVLRELETMKSRPPSWSAASCGRAAASASGATSRCSVACAAPRWRRCARKSSRPTRVRWRPSCPPGRASTATGRVG